MKKVAVALATGNTVVVKPPEIAPWSIVELARTLAELAAEKKLTAQLRKEAEQRETVLKAVQQVRSTYYGYIFLPDEIILFGNIVR